MSAITIGTGLAVFIIVSISLGWLLTVLVDAPALQTLALIRNRSKPDKPDLEVINASREMVNLDNPIDRLHEKYGDDADSPQDYLALEAKRNEMLKVLFSKRAQTPAGMVAKASALRESSVVEDFAVQGKIAIALARDVMQYFGAVGAEQTRRGAGARLPRACLNRGRIKPRSIVLVRRPCIPNACAARYVPTWRRRA